MAEPKPEKRGKGAGFYAVVVLLTVIALYPLSIGPVMGYYYAKKSPRHRFVNYLYAPLFKSARHPAIGKPLAAYIDLWLPPTYDARWSERIGVATDLVKPRAKP